MLKRFMPKLDKKAKSNLFCLVLSMAILLTILQHHFNGCNTPGGVFISTSGDARSLRKVPTCNNGPEIMFRAPSSIAEYVGQGTGYGR